MVVSNGFKVNTAGTVTVVLEAVVPRRRFTVWQCRDWCCEAKPFSLRWWNVGIAPGNYHSVPNLTEAAALVRVGRLPWSVEL